MGTGASSNVKTVNIQQNEEDTHDQTEQRPDRPWSSVSAMLRHRNVKKKNTGDLEELKLLVLQSKALISEEQQKTSAAQDQVKALEEQVAELESGKLDLEEHIQILEEKLEEIHANQVVTQSSDVFKETLLSKDQQINRLEQQIQTQEAELQKLKVKHKKKVKTLTGQLAETRHELSLQMFEMKSEIEQLTQDNNEMKAKIPEEEVKSPEENSFFLTERCSSSLGGNEENRNKIILELSERLSEQEEEIESLKAYIKQQKEEIKRAKTVQSKPESTLVNGTNVKEEIPAGDSHTQAVLHRPQPPDSSKKSQRGHTHQRLRPVKQTSSDPGHHRHDNSLDVRKTEKNDSNIAEEMKLIASEMKKLQKEQNKSNISTNSSMANDTASNSVFSSDVNHKMATGWLDEDDFQLPVASPICTH